ncbi:MAG: metal ABC transporter ATP-binding protein [Candidatus Nanopelagicales bacterium]
MDDSTPVICCDDLCVDFESSCVLSNIDLDIYAGDFTDILGVNGSGKTTLMRAMLGLISLTSGDVRVYGADLPRFRDWQRLAYVPQRLHSAGAVPVSVHEVVGASLISPRRRWPRRRDRATVTNALELVGLEHRRKDRFDSLSGGQQQRVMIAAALAKKADLYILDEPTAGVDAESQERITDTFRHLQSEGRTVLLVTHELGTFASLATRIVVLGSHTGVGSKVLYDGPPPVPEHLSERHWHHSEDVVPRSKDPGLLEPGNSA